MELKEILVSKGLEEEKANEVLSEMKENNIYLSREENIDERYSKLKSQKEEVEKERDTANETIENLKADNKTNDDLQHKIEDYEKQLESLKEESASKQKQSAIQLALVKEGAKNTKAVQALLNSDELELTDDGVKGLSEQLEALKESDNYLFHSEEEQGSPRIQTGEDPNEGSKEEVDAFKEAADKYI